MAFFDYDPETVTDINLFKWIMFVSTVVLVCGVVGVFGWLFMPV
jgi:hypothetical protein